MQIDNQFILNLVQDIKSSLGKIDTSLKTVIDRIDDHETRIRHLEHKLFYLMGAIALGAFIINFFKK